MSEGETGYLDFSLNRPTAFQNDAKFFVVSVAVSFILSSLRIIDLFCFTYQYYAEVDFGSGPIFLPHTDVFEEVKKILAFQMPLTSVFPDPT